MIAIGFLPFEESGSRFTIMISEFTFCVRHLWVFAIFFSFGFAGAEAQDASGDTMPADVRMKISEIQDLQTRQRYTDALQKLSELEADHPEIADIYNIRGSIWLAGALRDYDKSKEQFEKALQLRPNAMAVLFNMAELEFVVHHFDVAEQKFAALLADAPKIPLPIRHLILYKQAVCKVKQGQTADAQEMIKKNFTFMDDTPAYYYANAAIAFQNGDKPKAQEWMARAEAIFGKSAVTPYVDTLVEARWLPHIGLPEIEDEPKAATVPGK